MTEEEIIKLLSDKSKTNEELTKILNCSIPTITRRRRKYGIIVPRGLKTGQRNGIVNKYKSNCIVCKKEFETTPSVNKLYCSRICVCKDDNYRLKLKNADKSYMQTEEYKKTLMKEDTPKYKRYRNRVTKLSEKVYEENKSLLNPNCYIRTKCGIENGYQLDHKISVRESFDKGISPEEVSKLENLQILPWKQNLLKR